VEILRAIRKSARGNPIGLRFKTHCIQHAASWIAEEDVFPRSAQSKPELAFREDDEAAWRNHCPLRDCEFICARCIAEKTAGEIVAPRAMVVEFDIIDIR